MSYDAIVIGAGISGASTAYHLGKAGAKTLLIERGEPASGGTGKSAAIIRQSYSTPLLVAPRARQHQHVRNRQGRSRPRRGLRADGYCFVVSHEMLEGAKEKRCDAEGAGHRQTNGAKGQAFRSICPRSIRTASPVSVTSRMAVTPIRCGRPKPMWRVHDSRGELRARTPVRRLLRQGDGVTAVELDTGEVTARYVVNAAGPWAKPLAASAGLDLPLRSVREQDTVWQVPAGRAVRRPRSRWASTPATTGRSGKGRFIIGRGFPKDYVDVDPTITKPVLIRISSATCKPRVERASRRFRDEADRSVCGALRRDAGLVSVRRPARGRRPAMPDFSGGSGHGFKIAPAIAKELADWLLNGEAADDFRQFSHDRIAQGNLFVQSFGGNRG